MPSTTETPEQIEKNLKHAFAKFDSDGDGKITKSELVGILTKPLPNRTPFTVAQAEERFAKMDLNSDGVVDFDEFSKAYAKNLFDSTGGAYLPSPPPPPGQKADSKTAPPDFSSLIKKGKVLPDEEQGPYAFDRYHTNDRGADRGFFENPGGNKKWRDSNTEKLKKWPSLAAIDWDHPDAPDPDFALQHFTLAGMKLRMDELRPKIIEAQSGMKELYTKAFDEAFAGAGPTLEKIKQLKKDGPKKERQPGGKDLDIFGLFKGALGAIGELWAYGLEVREASGEHDAELSWGLKHRPASSQGPSWRRHNWPRPTQPTDFAVLGHTGRHTGSGTNG